MAGTGTRFPRVHRSRSLRRTLCVCSFILPFFRRFSEATPVPLLDAEIQHGVPTRRPVTQGGGLSLHGGKLKPKGPPTPSVSIGRGTVHGKRGPRQKQLGREGTSRQGCSLDVPDRGLRPGSAFSASQNSGVAPEKWSEGLFGYPAFPEIPTSPSEKREVLPKCKILLVTRAEQESEVCLDFPHQDLLKSRSEALSIGKITLIPFRDINLVFLSPGQ